MYRGAYELETPSMANDNKSTFLLYIAKLSEEGGEIGEMESLQVSESKLVKNMRSAVANSFRELILPD